MIIRITKYKEDAYPITYIYKRGWFRDKLLYRYSVRYVRCVIPGIEYGSKAAIPRKSEVEWKYKFVMLYSHKIK
jgi:hypothetical protein